MPSPVVVPFIPPVSADRLELEALLTRLPPDQIRVVLFWVRRLVRATARLPHGRDVAVLLLSIAGTS